MAINQRKAGSILSYIYIFLSNTISLIYTPIMLGILGQSEYGLIGTANSITSYLSLLSMGIGASYVRFNAQARATGDKEKEYRTNGMFQTIYIVISIITLIVGMVLVFLSPYIFQANYSDTQLEEIKWIMICTVIQFVITFLFNTTAMTIQAYERFVFIRLCLIIACVLQPCINLLLLYHGGNVVTISVATLVISFLTYVVYYCYAKKVLDLKYKFDNFDKNLFKNIFVFSAFLFLNTITDQLTFSTDNIILGIFSGSIMVAIYSVGSNFKNYFMAFSTSASSVFAPKINKIIAESGSDDETNEIFIRIGRIQFYIVTLILLGYIFWGRQFVYLWVGNEYSDAYWIGLLLMISVYVPCFQNIGLEIQKAKNMHKARSVVYLFIAITNVFISIPLIKLIGPAGAALGTAISLIAGNIIFMNWYYHARIGMNMIYFWKEIAKLIPALVAPCAVGIVIMNFVNITGLVKLGVFAVVYTAVYGLSMYFFGMNEEEKQLVMGPIRKILRK